jgi:uncharacterized repeat protein (TIGR03803 family)
MTFKFLLAAALTASAMLPCPTASAGKLKTLYAFPGSQKRYGAHPTGNLIYNSVLTGEAPWGGPDKHGTVYQVDPTNGSLSLLYSIPKSINRDFGDSLSLTSANGLFYGTTDQGGAHGAGTVFSLNPATGVETTLYDFNTRKAGELGAPDWLIAARGALYGIATGGGAYSQGGIFKVNLVTGHVTTEYSYNLGRDGNAVTGLGTLLYANKMLYATAASGGQYAEGVVFSFNPETKQEQTLYTFTAGTDGAYPGGGLIYAHGMLYGTTSSYWGGCGTAFEMDPASGTETTLYTFACNDPNGSSPNGPLVYRGHHLYGTTLLGGVSDGYLGNGYGTIFEIDLATRTERALHRFTGGDDGAYPQFGLTLVNSGTQDIFYGATSGRWPAVDTNSNGTVFSFIP